MRASREAGQPLVEVILPIHRPQPRWLMEAAQSILNQTFSGWRLTLIEDACPDRKSGPISDLIRNHKAQMRVIRLAENLGAPGARMAAANQTDCEFLAFIDQDDRWHPEKLQSQLEKMLTTPNLGGVHCDVEHIDEQGEILTGRATAENSRRARVDFNRIGSADLVRSLFCHNSVRLSSALVRRRDLLGVGGFRTDLCGGEDWEFWIRFAQSHRLAHIDSRMVERRIHRDNTSSRDAARRQRGLLAAIAIVVRQEPSLGPLVRRRRATLCRWESARLRRLGLARRATQEAAQAIQWNPTDWRSWLQLGLSCLAPIYRTQTSEPGALS